MSELLNTEPLDRPPIDLKLLDKALSSKNIKLTSDYGTLITKLLFVHATGMLHYSVSTNSFELRIPDPELLKQDGPKEISSKHLYINLTKYIKDQHPASARCVKNGKIYKVADLLSMPQLEYRSEDLGWDVKKYLDKFRKKSLIIPKATLETSADFKPEPPGACIPITDLAESHVAIQYLYSRGFTKDQLPDLYKQFNLSYCISTPNDFYADQYMGLSKSPVGKLIFFIYHSGILKGWQARRIEKCEGSTVYHWHLDTKDHYKTGWIPVAKIDSETGKQIPLPEVPKSVLNSKYVIGFGTRASESILGFDAALEYSKTHPDKPIVLVEGALDAAKFGVPACSVFGCRVSRAQVKAIVNDFNKIYLIKDHDNAGEELEASLKQELMQYTDIKFQEIEYPKCFKDIGEINDMQVIKDLRLKYNLN